MELRVNFNSFVKIKDAIRINDICGEILDYQLTTDGVSGKLGINGKYFKDDLEKENTFNDEIPFDIIFTTPEFELIDVDCINLDYDLIDGRGIEVNFDIRVEYNELTNALEVSLGEEEITDLEENLKDDSIREVETKIEEDELEKIKDEVTTSVSEKLQETLTLKDNLPTKEEKVLDNFEEKRSCIKVCYYNNDKELEKVCQKNDISLDQVFKDNKNNDIAKYQRIIIK